MRKLLVMIFGSLIVLSGCSGKILDTDHLESSSKFEGIVYTDSKDLKFKSKKIDVNHYTDDSLSFNKLDGEKNPLFFSKDDIKVKYSPFLIIDSSIEDKDLKSGMEQLTLKTPDGSFLKFNADHILEDLTTISGSSKLMLDGKIIYTNLEYKRDLIQ